MPVAPLEKYHPAFYTVVPPAPEWCDQSVAFHRLSGRGDKAALPRKIRPSWYGDDWTGAACRYSYLPQSQMHFVCIDAALPGFVQIFPRNWQSAYPYE